MTSIGSRAIAASLAILLPVAAVARNVRGREADQRDRLTDAERRRPNRRENALSNRIHTARHNDIAQPGVMPRQAVGP